MKLNVKKINQELNRLKWRKADYARALGVDRQSVHYYLNHNISSMRIIEKLAKPLNLNPKDLII